MAIPFWTRAKDPTDVDEWRFDWTERVGFDDDGLPTNDIIATASWSVPGSSGLVIESEDFDDLTTTVKLSGGSIGYHQITCTITTFLARTLQRSAILSVTER